MNIYNLPLDIFIVIQQFTCINLLLNTTQKFNDVKKKLYYHKLNKKYSCYFCFNSKIRNDILNKINLSNKQIN